MRTLSRPFLVACGLTLLLAGAAVAQNNNGGGNNGGGNNGGGNNGGGGGGGGFGAAGVLIDPNGTLKMRRFDEPNGQLTMRRIAEARARLPGNLAQQAPLRKVSLNRLEAAIAQRAANGQGPTDEMKYLAGLTRAQYVFFYPETRDIVIAGPAEGYVADPSGRMIGMNSGRAIVELQDLVVALRAYPPQGKPTQIIACSIDATQEGLANLQKFFASFHGRLPSGGEARIAEGARNALGLQVVTIRGLSPKTHFAQVLVEADYRMKLIGIGLEQPPVRIPSYASLATAATVRGNAMQRWFFTPNYECVKVSEDELAMELVGDGVKLIGEDEVVQADGTRVAAAGGKNKASQQFCQQFTTNYAQLAQRSPVYGQLRNLIDCSVAAAFIQQQDYYGKCAWKMEHFGDEKKYPVETCETPKMVETACSVLKKGSQTAFPIGGGVHIEARTALEPQYRVADDGGKLQAVRNKVTTDKLTENQWWWD
ncbi:hypothetical protein ETAA8_62610 [Anatilimnocola aggregata]|uniref:DUF1598 domain-containing protein n=1 Tax=Anatilimnocola aggregata TaxID=2528021 RepID=A0A517YLN0_9BACT|nr:DUF1598 domain-containing protein [Anatilimnocola aggregata]QDU31108.1 hypothetical protein ETAA8_62610 [Anatilimnocola aggregata]